MPSAKVNSRGSSVSKRFRNDASHGDGDWTCPDCGNVNFAFRMVCNIGKCGARRPPVTPQISMSASPNDGDWTCPECGNVNYAFRIVCNIGKCGARRPPVTPPAPITSPYNYPPPLYFGGVGAPPVPIGVSGRYGNPMPLPRLRYDYSVAGGSHGPYALLPAFPHGTLGGIAYGSQSPISEYGFGFMGSPWSGGSIPDGSASRKRRGGPDSLSEGDWICPNCENVNFSFRTTCNMKKCGAARPLPGPNQSNSGPPEGSWTCSKCNNLNYPFRTVCNKKGCGNEKPASGE